MRQGLYLLSAAVGVGSTRLLLVVARSVAAARGRVLYVTTEESVADLARHAREIGDVPRDLMATHECELYHIVDKVEEYRPDLLIVDSLQFINAPVHLVVKELRGVAISSNVAVLALMRERKDGRIAGGKAVHLVDAILSLKKKGESRLFSCDEKNRFGAVGSKVYLDAVRMVEQGAAQ